MSIEVAKKEEITIIFELLRACGEHMRSNGLFQWNDHYPRLELVEEDVVAGTCYTYKVDGQLAAVISMDENQSPEYKQIIWKYLEEPVFVVHRLAVHPNFQGKGIARILMGFAEDHARTEGYRSIRLDAYSENERACTIYRLRGYQYRGDIFFPFRDKPFFCFEKKL